MVKDRNYFEFRTFILGPLIALFLLVVVMGLVLFLQAKPLAATSIYGDFRYEVVEIEGMPCVVASGGNYFGITCDWSRWDSE